MLKSNVKGVRNGLSLRMFKQKSMKFVISDKWVDEVSRGDTQAVKMMDVKDVKQETV